MKLSKKPKLTKNEENKTKGKLFQNQGILKILWACLWLVKMDTASDWLDDIFFTKKSLKIKQKSLTTNTIDTKPENIPSTELCVNQKKVTGIGSNVLDRTLGPGISSQKWTESGHTAAWSLVWCFLTVHFHIFDQSTFTPSSLMLIDRPV